MARHYSSCGRTWEMTTPRVGEREIHYKDRSGVVERVAQLWLIQGKWKMVDSCGTAWGSFKSPQQAFKAFTRAL